MYIESQGCIPNARRDGFEDTAEWSAIKSELGSFLKDREKEVRTSSKLRSDEVGKSIRAAIISAEKAQTSAAAGVTSVQEREKLINQLEEQKAKLDEIAPIKIPEELQATYDQAVSDVTEAIKSVEAAEFVVAQTKGQLDRKQKKLLQDILETLQECLPPDMFALARKAIMNRFESKEK